MVRGSHWASLVISFTVRRSGTDKVTDLFTYTRWHIGGLHTSCSHSTTAAVAATQQSASQLRQGDQFQCLREWKRLSEWKKWKRVVRRGAREVYVWVEGVGGVEGSGGMWG